jgi:predicted site-specific integrase-resolvase
MNAFERHRAMSLKEWCDWRGISLATGKRQIKAGKGPRITQLSERRVAITVGDAIDHAEACAEPKAA